MIMNTLHSVAFAFEGALHAHAAPFAHVLYATVRGCIAAAFAQIIARFGLCMGDSLAGLVCDLELFHRHCAVHGCLGSRALVVLVRPADEPLAHLGEDQLVVFALWHAVRRHNCTEDGFTVLV